MNEPVGTVLSSRRAYAIVVAAGAGRRMAMTTNKPFLDLAGIPVIIRTLSAFESADSVSGVILVASPSECDSMKQLVAGSSLTGILAVVPGGTTRQQSVYHGLTALSQNTVLHPDTPVIVHDGARCLVSGETINRVVEGIIKHGACGAAVPAKDTVKLVSPSGNVLQTPERSGVWLMQTPQGAVWKHLWSAYEQAESENWQTTDDLSVLEQAGIGTSVVMGDYRNFKLTTREDLSYAIWLMGQSNG